MTLTLGRLDYLLSCPFALFIRGFHFVTGQSSFTLGRIAAIVAALCVVSQSLWLIPLGACMGLVEFVTTARYEREFRDLGQPTLQTLRMLHCARIGRFFDVGLVILSPLIGLGLAWMMALVFLVLGDYCKTTTGGAGKSVIDRLLPRLAFSS